MDTIWTTRGFPELTFEEMKDPDRARYLIQKWVSGGQPEDLYLDFKRKSKPKTGAPDANDKRTYAKALSGFANSDGGLLVWGVVAEQKDKRDPESPDVATGAAPISPLNTFIARLNDIAAYSTRPAVAGVENLGVEEKAGSKTGYAITYIPAGLHPPYRAENGNNNQYYRRSGSRFNPLEPYELRDIVFRFRYPKVELTLGYDRVQTDPHVHRYVLRVEARNWGPSTLRGYKLSIDIPKALMQRGLVSAPPWHLSEYNSAVFGLPYTRYSLLTPEAFAVYAGEHSTVLGPKEPYPLVYQVDGQNERIANGPGIISCTLFGNDMPPVTVSHALADMHEF